MSVKSKQITQLLQPIAIFAALIVYPLMIMPYDMWDGVILDFASKTKNYEGLRSYFSESTWFMQYPLTIAIDTLSRYLGASFKLTNACVVAATALALVLQVRHFARDILNLSDSSVQLGLLLMVSSPVWTNLLSSVMTFHFFALALGMWVVKSIHARKGAATILGVPLLLISYSYNSMLVFLPVLSYAYDIKKEKTDLGQSVVAVSSRTAIIFTSAAVYFTVTRLFFPPHGLYAGYNAITLNPFSIVRGLTNYSSFLFIPCVLTLPALLKTNNKSAGGLLRLPKNNTLVTLLLSVAAVFPYVLVGKSTSFFNIKDWDLRQAFPLVIPIALLSAVIYNHSERHWKSPAKFSAVRVSMLFVLAASLLLQGGGVVYKLNRQKFVSEIVNVLRQLPEPPAEGILQVVGTGMPGPEFRNYESNYYTYIATGRASWWTYFKETVESKPSVPEYLRKGGAYSWKYIYFPNPVQQEPTTVVHLKIEGYTGIVNAMRNVFVTSTHARVSLLSVEAPKPD